ncbi:MAG: DUF2934 domain-containing protein [Verrucomicrobiae bacterium]
MSPIIPSMEDISACANLIWENEGRPEGREKAHWYQAEDQLMTCHVLDHWMLSSQSMGVTG